VPEIPAFGHDIWVTLARIAEKTKRIKLGPFVLIPSAAHRAIRGDMTRATLDALRDAPGPMTTIELARHVMAERGLNTADKALLQLFTRRTGRVAAVAEIARHLALGQRPEARSIRSLGNRDLNGGGTPAS
jgi:hypothetical protein